MIVRTYNAVRDSANSVDSEGWNSVRMLLKQDGMGFSFHITTINAGADLNMHYQNHLESVFCISGVGELTDEDSGEVYKILPGTLYALDQHDRHRLTAETELTMACVFSPPLTGQETHDVNGSYPANES